MNGKGSRRRPTNTENFSAGYDRAFRSEDMSNPEREPRKGTRMIRESRRSAPPAEIFALRDIKVHKTDEGNEYAAVPIRNPSSPKSAPHKWMPMVNGHLTGEKWLVESCALDAARELANTPATN